MTELFRRQAVDHQRQRFHGAIVLTRSPWQTAVAAFFVLLVLALMAFAATQGFARKESVGGVLMPAGGVLRLVAPQAGVVAATPVAQGAHVRGGAGGGALSSEQSSATRPHAGGRRALAGAAPGQPRRRTPAAGPAGAPAGRVARRARRARCRPGLAQQEREIALQRERVQLVREVAGRYPDLVRSGAVSPVEAAEKQTELLDQQARLSELERARGAAQAELATLRADRASLPLQAGRESAQMRREVQALAQAQAENESHRGTQVLAPQAGEIAALLAAPGQPVVAGQTLATLLPAGAALEAELWVPTRSAGFVRAGMPVWLRVDAFPYARYGQLPAHVREVSRARSARRLGDAARGRRGAARRATCSACSSRSIPTRRRTPRSPGARRCKAGMRVQASLVAERRTLVQWALEPLAALRVAAR